MSLTIPVWTRFPDLVEELTKALPDVNFHKVSTPDNDPYFFQSEIIICDFDRLGPHLYNLPNAKWIQGTWAGVDFVLPYVRKSAPIPLTITRFSGEHLGRMMGEYALGNIINYERNLFGIRENQKKQQWVIEGRMRKYRIISDLTIGILGLGPIGCKVGQMLHLMGAKVLGLGRRSTLSPNSENSHISKYYTTDSLTLLLKECDYLINILPYTPETKGLLNNGILKNCEDKGTIFMNIGRGNIISEDSILEAIDNKWISAAILDVFEIEPLPQESRLWQLENVFITPHVAGIPRTKDLAQQFRTNLVLYQKGLPLPSQADLNNGY